MSSTQDRLARALSKIRSLRTTLTDTTLANKYEVSENYVKEYDEALEHLSALGYDIDEFAVPKNMLKRSASSANMMSGKVKYRSGLWVERTFLLMKLDSALGYFDFMRGDDIAEGKIGFSGKKKD